MTDEETAAQIEVECEALKGLLLRKNKDYGNSAINGSVLLPGLSPREAIQVRMSDKIARLERLLSSNKEPAVKEEAIDETMSDLAGYAILWRIAK